MLILLGVIIALYLGRSIFIPLVIAILLAALVWPAAYFLNQWLRFSWGFSCFLFVLLFLLVDGRMLSRRLVETFGPSKEAQTMAVETLAEMARAVRTFLVWRTLVNFALAVICGLAYQWVFKLSQPWTWALFTAIA